MFYRTPPYARETSKKCEANPLSPIFRFVPLLFSHPDGITLIRTKKQTITA